MTNFSHWIDGAFVAPSSGAYLERCSPATGMPLAAYALGNAADVEVAVTAARRGFESAVWCGLSGGERGAVLMHFAELVQRDRETLARLEAEESGKAITGARGEIAYCVDLIRFAAACAWNITGQAMSHSGADKLGLVLHEPRGVVALIIPWNFPMVCLIQKLPYALAAGCAVVAKPSEFTSGTALKVAELLKEAGLPDGQFNVVTGTGEDVGEALTAHPEVDMISFTGSSAVGRHVACKAADGVKHVVLELGGKGANIVFADADFEAAIEGAVQGFVINKGEECCAGGRILVERTIAAEFTTRLVARVEALKIGLPLDETAELGPLITARQLERVLGYIETGRQQGARLITGGGRETSPGLAAGNYVQPTIFADVTREMTIFREEIFGPVAVIIPFDTLDEAILIANDTPYGLANGVWTRDIGKAMAVIRRVRSGMVYVNTYLETIPQLPFGGMKQSGAGRENGIEGLMAYMDTKAAFIRLQVGFD